MKNYNCRNILQFFNQLNKFDIFEIIKQKSVRE